MHNHNNNNHNNKRKLQLRTSIIVIINTKLRLRNLISIINENETELLGFCERRIRTWCCRNGKRTSDSEKRNGYRCVE